MSRKWLNRTVIDFLNLFREKYSGFRQPIELNIVLLILDAQIVPYSSATYTEDGNYIIIQDLCDLEFLYNLYEYISFVFTAIKYS